MEKVKIITGDIPDIDNLEVEWFELHPSGRPYTEVQLKLKVYTFNSEEDMPVIYTQSHLVLELFRVRLRRGTLKAIELEYTEGSNTGYFHIGQPGKKIMRYDGGPFMSLFHVHDECLNIILGFQS